MHDLEKQQNEMRERVKRQTKTKPTQTARVTHKASVHGQTDLDVLKQRIKALETEIAKLRTENERLRCQKTVTVHVEREKSANELRREQQHNYFKYSNARRW